MRRGISYVCRVSRNQGHIIEKYTSCVSQYVDRSGSFLFTMISYEGIVGGRVPR